MPHFVVAYVMFAISAVTASLLGSASGTASLALLSPAALLDYR